MKSLANIVQTGKDQSIIVSGESGAGKTETVKFLLNHLAALSHSDNSELINKVKLYPVITVT